MFKPTAKGYFSGCGGMELGMMQAGVNIIQSLDLDKRATDTMIANPHYFNHPILHKDIKDITVLQQHRSDIIIGTYPCTKYSTIADIHGCRTGDDLFLHFFRHIAIEQPEMYVVENVPGMKKFPIVMEAMTRLPQYYINVFCPMKTTNWLPQKRDRLILIGTKKPFFIMEPSQIANRPRIKDLMESNPDINIPKNVLSRLKGKYRDLPIIVDPDQPGAMAPTCVAHYAKDQGTRLVKDKKGHFVNVLNVRRWLTMTLFRTVSVHR